MELEPPSYFDNRERIIYSVTWPIKDEIALTWENRHQNYRYTQLSGWKLYVYKKKQI